MPSHGLFHVKQGSPVDADRGSFHVERAERDSPPTQIEVCECRLRRAVEIEVELGVTI